MEADNHMGEYANPDALVTTDWVAEHLNDGSIRLVEVDEDTEAYEKGHIPGANSFHWRNELQDPVNRDFVDKAHFEQLLSRKGIGNDDLVVLYGGNNNWFAAYAYWYLKVYGHDNVKLMNGGRKKWELEGRELTSDGPNVAATSYTAKDADPSIRALRDEVIAAVGNKPMIDVRSPDEFSGKLAAPAHLPQEQAQRKGHIPGAKNVPWSKAANEDGTFKSIDELKALYQEEQGLVPEDETIAYCRIGERSSHTWFVLRELLGFPRVKNYDGSWTEYGSLVGVPIQLDYKEEAKV
jgi:thiosulfate/3-mercaptopyruvate sulfurtransferase